MSRIMRIDENHASDNLNEGLKKVVAARRPVLGELGNKVVVRHGSQDILTKGAEKGASLKGANATLKNIKPRVDTRWRKAENVAVAAVQKKPITRSDSIKTVSDVKTVTIAGAKNQSTAPEAVKVQVQLNKGNEVKHVGLKREESQLSLRTLAKQNRKGKQKTSCSAASSTEEIDAIPSTKKTERLDTHSQKLLEGIENIDINDAWNPMLVSEYVNDIYRYLNRLEESPGYALNENFLEGHKEITHKMRTILIDWINEVHHQFKLDIDTYHMTVSLIDRYLQKVKTIPKKKLQLVGVTAMFIASKYEELFPPEIHDFVFITDDTYQKQQILEMEKEIVKQLDFNLGKPLPTHFLRRFSKAAKASDVNHVLAKYLIELASVDYTTAHYKPSEIAAAALYISLYLFPVSSRGGNGSSGKIWTRTLEHYTNYSVLNLTPIVRRLASVVIALPKMMDKKLKSPWLKYSSSKLQCISTHPKLKGIEIDMLIERELPQ